MSATEFTPSLHLAKPDFNIATWHDEVNGNMDIIDSIIFAFTGVTGIVGPWTNNTNYVVGNRVIDLVSSRLYQCAIAHTSAATGTFLQDRTAHPTFWTLVSVGIPDPANIPGDLTVGGNVSIVGSASFGAINNTPIGQIVPAAGKFTDLAYTGTFTLLGSAAPTPTAEGQAAWDTDDNFLVIGDGAATRRFQPSPSSSDEHIARFDGSLGLLQDSVVTISNTGDVGNILTIDAQDGHFVNELHSKNLRLVPVAPSVIGAIYMEQDTDLMVLQGGRTGSTGGQLLLFGPAHATAPNNVSIFSAGLEAYSFDQPSGSHNFFDNTHTRTAHISPTSLNVGNITSINPAVIGTSISGGGQIVHCRSADTCHILNRTTSDGVLSTWRRQNVDVGFIDVAAGVVGYLTFMGAHISQWAGQRRLRLLRGTIMESVDEICYWEQDSKYKFDEILPKAKVSDTVGSNGVYGVFHAYDLDDKLGDIKIASLGAFVIRMATGSVAKRGDLIESNGDGCGRVQDSNMVLSSTVGKVTSGTIIKTYADGSYIVPAVLCCG